jgi:hypothetical protein
MHKMNVNLKGTALANYLAVHLSDLEFELLIRERIKWLFDKLHSAEPNLYEGNNSCRFTMSWTDNAEWHVRIGENYNKIADVEGQVLSRCCHDVAKLYEMKNGNKLSLLLPAPTSESDDEEDEDGDMKW